MKELAMNPLVMALASGVVHAHEIIDQIEAGKNVPTHDIAALRGNIRDAEELLAYMDGLALLPVRRDGVGYKP